MRLLYVVSDHGFGHATRTIAILREALGRNPALTVRLVTGPGAAVLLRNCFDDDERVTVVVRDSDPGLLLLPGSLRVDTPGTSAAWQRWVDSWESWSAAEADVCGPIDAVLTDGSPPALDVARRRRVPGLLLGNFAWTDVLSWHLSDGLLQSVRRSLSLATESFAFPFSLPFDGAPPPRRLPLVARRPVRSRQEIRQELGIAIDEPLICMSVGRSSDPDVLWRAARDCGATPLVPAGAPEIPGCVRIPEHATEGQDYIAAADLVAGKVGYGTLSEALVAGVPMVMVLVDRTPETAPLRDGMLEANAGETAGEMDDLRPAIGRWLGRGGGRERPYCREDTAGAASILLEAIISSS